MSSTDRCPRRRPGVEIDDDNTVRSADGTRHLLNDTALALWELCDGHIHPNEMVDAICALFDATEVMVAPDVGRLLDEFTRLGLVDWVARSVPAQAADRRRAHRLGAGS